jgi:hypothetical protein
LPHQGRGAFTNFVRSETAKSGGKLQKSKVVLVVVKENKMAGNGCTLSLHHVTTDKLTERGNVEAEKKRAVFHTFLVDMGAP